MIPIKFELLKPLLFSIPLVFMIVSHTLTTCEPSEISYFVRDSKGKMLTGLAVKIHPLQQDGSYGLKRFVVSYATFPDPITKQISCFYIGCGRNNASYQISLADSPDVKMEVRFINVPAGKDFCVDAIDFRPGIFEIDLSKANPQRTNINLFRNFEHKQITDAISAEEWREIK